MKKNQLITKMLSTIMVVCTLVSCSETTYNTTQPQITTPYNSTSPTTLTSPQNEIELEDFIEDDLEIYSIDDFSVRDTVLIHYYGSDEDVVVPDEITVIGNCSFNNNINMQTLVIPDSVTIIEPFAFMECENLTNITLPDTITEIGFRAFSLCISLESIVLPNSLTEIGESVFQFCTQLKTVEIPDSVTYIDEYAFDNINEIEFIYNQGSYAETWLIEHNYQLA